MAGLSARFLYAIASFYFDTTFGLVTGATRATLESHTWSVLVELWLRQLLGWLAPATCFARSEMACQLADQVGRLGSLGISVTLISVVPAVFAVWVAHRLLSRRKHRDGQGNTG